MARIFAVQSLHRDSWSHTGPNRAATWCSYCWDEAAEAWN